MWNLFSKKYPYTEKEVKSFSSGLFVEDVKQLPIEIVVEYAVELAMFWYVVRRQYGK